MRATATQIKEVAAKLLPVVIGPAMTLNDERKMKLMQSKTKLAAKMKKVNEELGIKSASSNGKFHFPKGKRSGKYAKILNQRDKWIAFENLLHKADKGLFIIYLENRKVNMSLNDWKAKFELSADELEKGKKLL